MPEIKIDKAQMLRSANDSARLILRKLAADTKAREALRPVTPAEPEIKVDAVAANLAHLKLVMAQLDGLDTSVIEKAIAVAEAAESDVVVK